MGNAGFLSSSVVISRVTLVIATRSHDPPSSGEARNPLALSLQSGSFSGYGAFI